MMAPRTRRYWLYAGTAMGGAAAVVARLLGGVARAAVPLACCPRTPCGRSNGRRWTAAPCPWKACVGAPPW